MRDLRLRTARRVFWITGVLAQSRVNPGRRRLLWRGLSSGFGYWNVAAEPTEVGLTAPSGPGLGQDGGC
jgi:hypothetical protein